MSPTTRIATLLLLLLAFGSPAINAADNEAAIVQDLERRVTLGKPVWLGDGDSRFFAIYMEETTAEPLGAVLLLHGAGEHADWPVAIGPLRRYLPDYGWATLAIQLPTIPPEGLEDATLLFEQSKQRIQAGLSYLLGRGEANILLLGHGLGAAVAIDYLDTHPEEAIGVVGVSMSAPHHSEERLDTAIPLQRLLLPVLDIYAQRDRQEVLHSADRRAKAARKGKNEYYRQVAIPGSDGSFRNSERLLLTQVRGWLKTTFVKEVKKEDAADNMDNSEPTPPMEPMMAPMVIEPPPSLPEEEPIDNNGVEPTAVEQDNSGMAPAPEPPAAPKPPSAPVQNPTGPQGLF